MDSYGYVETLGLVTAIEAADAALKAANVTLMNCYYVKGGIVTIEVAGDVSAVTAAVDAATESAKRLGNFLSSNVIARIDSETKKILISDLGNKEKKQKIENKSVVKDTTIEKKATEKISTEEITEEVTNESKNENFDEEQNKEINEKVTEIAEVYEKVENPAEKLDQNNDIQKKIEVFEIEVEKEDDEAEKLKKQYQGMKVIDLKKMVNSCKLGYTWNQIKTMPKKKLIEILIKNNKEEAQWQH